MRQSRLSGSVEGVMGNHDSYSDIIALLWLASGVYITAKPDRFIRNTQFPWTKMPPWGARMLGSAIFIGGMLILRAYILQKAN